MREGERDGGRGADGLDGTGDGVKGGEGDGEAEGEG